MHKKESKKAHHIKKEHHHSSPLEEAMIKNLIELQKVNVGLAEKFDKLAKEISQLLGLFEITAKRFASHAALGEYEKDKEFLEKIDTLLDQNKTLAKGLTLMEERLRERVYGSSPITTPPQYAPRPQQFQPALQRPQPPQQTIQPKQTQEIEETFEPSI